MSGLAPVNSNAEAPDRQADDVRYYAAASEQPLPEIGIAAFADPAKRTQFAQMIRNYLLAEGYGY
ncbi:hypothetical protein K7I13_09780 [Brucepastera parasyntrophica]|uniref:hypothetical protein n=1 Tax=Brucepastera parasyntrophica TaxID=2880008 RepID=UPI00210CFE76|nr:hypothetical protein [Brucepastera parasyntrophica]ULQ58822.1 hypothetical protein K7I13_09780 [Brucepastera parasyntrophica]